MKRYGKRSGRAGAAPARGSAPAEKGRAETIIEVLRKAIDRFPNNTAAYLDMAHALRDLGMSGEAIATYKAAIIVSPDFVEAVSSLVALLYKSGRFSSAIVAGRHLIWLKPDIPQFVSNYGNGLQMVGRFAEAASAYKAAISLKPDFEDALSNLGNALKKNGQVEGAIRTLAAAIRARPELAEAHYNLATLLQSLKRHEEAAESALRALRYRPHHAEAHFNLALARHSQRRYGEGAISYIMAAVLKPEIPEIWFNLANLRRNQRREESAATLYRRAVILRPDYTDVYANFAVALQHLGQLGKSVAASIAALVLDPGMAAPYSNLGIVLHALGRTSLAKTTHHRAVTLSSQSAEAQANLGNSLKDLGQMEEAVAASRRAVVLKPDLAEALTNSGIALQGLGQIDAAVVACRRAVRVSPDDDKLHANLLLGLHYREERADGAILEAARDFGARIDTAPRAYTFDNSPEPERRLRVGYVSGDFRRHPVGFFLASVLTHHNRGAVEIFCYSNGAETDDFTDTLKARSDHWRNLIGVSDEAAASRIAADGIDILIDLSGHTALSRLPLFARRAAPVQASWLGYFGTTGVSAMDYIVADRYVVPEGEEKNFTEAVCRLPDSYLCFTPPDLDVPVLPAPMSRGEPLTFGNFNNHAKTSARCVAMWSQILRGAPGSRLLLKTKSLRDVRARERLLEQFAGHGILSDRLLLEGSSPRAELLASYNRVDIALDPTPYGGGTTTAEALWMGVPVVSLRGGTWVGRVSESILTAAGLSDLVAGGEDEYVSIALGLAGDQERLTKLRSGLRGRVEASPLCDAKRFVVHLESGFRQMWRRWCVSVVQSQKTDFAHAESLQSRGLKLRLTGGLIEAERLMLDSIQMRSDVASYYTNLGLVRHELGQPDAALAAHRAALCLDPGLAEAHYNQSLVLRERKQLGRALAYCKISIQIRPHFATAYAQLGILHWERDCFDEASHAGHKAIVLDPGLAPAHANLGLALKDFGNAERAVIAYERAVRLAPNLTEARANLGYALTLIGRMGEAAKACEAAIVLQPHSAGSYSNLGIALLGLRSHDEAKAAYNRALYLAPDLAEAHVNLGDLHKTCGRMEEAVAAYKTALRLKPGMIEALTNLGLALQDFGEPVDGCENHWRALRIRPAWDKAHSNLLLGLHYREDRADGAILMAARDFGVVSGVTHPSRSFANKREPERRLRVGYVSGDFRRHPVGFFLASVLAHHDRGALEIFCYSNGAETDDFTATLRTRSDHWRSLISLSDEAAATLIAEDEIDILIDLSGHTASNRLPLFARRAAPVQVSWLGYFGTTGVAAMDYILADRYVVQEGEETNFTEAICRLPDSYLCFTPPDLDVPVLPPPVSRNEPLTFGNFNNHAKTSARCVAMWSRILQSVPGSRLLLKTKSLGDARARERLLERFAGHGISADRLLLEGSSPRAELLASYNRVDIALDPTPYGGGTTTAEALWMGVPVVSLRGGTWVGRVSESILSTVGLSDLVAGNEDEYVGIATGLAQDQERLTELRSGLRATVEASPLCDAQRFVTHLECAFRSMWRRWCEREKGR